MGRTAIVRFVRNSMLAAGLAGSILAGTSAAQSSFLQWDGDSIGDWFGYSVGDAGDVVEEPGSFYRRHERVLMPLAVMALALLVVAFVPLLWT